MSKLQSVKLMKHLIVKFGILEEMAKITEIHETIEYMANVEYKFNIRRCFEGIREPDYYEIRGFHNNNNTKSKWLEFAYVSIKVAKTEDITQYNIGLNSENPKYYEKYEIINGQKIEGIMYKKSNMEMVVLFEQIGENGHFTMV